MRTFTVHYDFPCPPDEVFQALTDFARQHRWRPHDHVHVEPPGPVRVGTRLRSQGAGLGSFLRFTTEVVEFDPARRVFADRWLAGSFPLQIRWQVQPAAGGARLTAITAFEARGLLAPLAPLLGRALRRGQLSNLARLRRLLQPR